jgi:hypothetical protein
MALVLVLIGGGAWGKDVDSFLDGNLYMQQSQEFQFAYIMGVIDGLCHGEFPGGSSSPFSKCAKGKPPFQIKALIDKYMKENPQKWHYAMSSLIWVAVVKEGD